MVERPGAKDTRFIAENFPERINDFRDAVLAVGHKPAAS